MNRGTIMSINRKTATVFTRDCRMIRVDWQPGMAIGQEIPLDQASPVRAVTNRKAWLVPALVTACLAVLLIGGLFIGGAFAKPVYATLSIDVNPSIEFSLNRDLNVIRTRAVNDDARQLLQNHDFTGLNWQEALRQWVQILQSQNTIQVQNMLISAVLPEGAEELQTQLINMEVPQNQGDLANIQVRVIYSHDRDVEQHAALNGLSVGRQMLLNQARAQNAEADANAIAQGKLDELMGRFLQKGDRDQTRLTERSTQSLSDPSESTNGPHATETSRETHRETNREVNGSTAGSQETIRETERETNRETSGSTQGSTATSREAPPETSGPGPDQTSHTPQTSMSGNGPGR